MSKQYRKKVIVKHYSDDSGNRRQYFKSEKNLYCLQLESHSTAVWHTTTSYGEPDTPLSNTDFVDMDNKPIGFSMIDNVSVIDSQL